MPYEQGIFLDVFPRDGVLDGVIARKVHTALCFLVRKIMWSAVGRKTAGNRMIRWMYQWLYLLTKKKLPQICQWLQRISNADKTEYVRTLTFPLPNRLKGYRREWYQKYTKIRFEGYDFQVQASYEQWLSEEFGNYMELPPAEKRKTHPVTQIRFPEGA